MALVVGSFYEEESPIRPLEPLMLSITTRSNWLSLVLAGGAMRTIEFDGYQWMVKHGDEEKQGPGPNYFSSLPENVWVDSQGQLHLKVTKRNDRWYCAGWTRTVYFSFAGKQTHTSISREFARKKLRRGRQKAMRGFYFSRTGGNPIRTQNDWSSSAL
jgi:hypothetical protein